MPSLHVAVALWVALVVRACFPKLSAVGFTYFGLIFIGSFHLGWHYAVDAVAAVMIGVAAWLIAGISNFTASRPRIALAG